MRFHLVLTWPITGYTRNRNPDPRIFSVHGPCISRYTTPTFSRTVYRNTYRKTIRNRNPFQPRNKLRNRDHRSDPITPAASLSRYRRYQTAYKHSTQSPTRSRVRYNQSLQTQSQTRESPLSPNRITPSAAAIFLASPCRPPCFAFVRLCDDFEK